MFEKNASPAFKKYAIAIIVLGCIAMYFSCCLTTDALNVIQPAFTEKFGWSYSNISMPFTIGGYIFIPLSYVCGTILIKKGTKVFAVVSYGGSAFGALLLGISYSLDPEDVWVVYFIAAIILKIAVMMMQMAIFQLCASWFNSTRGRILGIVTMAAPLNSATSTSIMTVMMDVVGLTAIYIVIAIILAAAAIMAVFFAITSPEEKGLTPDGVALRVNEAPAQAIEKPVLTMKEILTKPQTWMLGIGFGFLNGIIGAVMAFFITRMTAVEVPTATALILLSASSIIGIPLSYIFGWVDDKFGTIKACRVLAVTYIVMLVCFIFGSNSSFPLIIIAALGMAAMTGACPNLHPSSIMHVFGAREYQNANRYISIIISVISAFGVQTMSVCLDRTGSMNIGYIIFTLEAVVALICLLMIRKKVVED